MRVNPLGSRRAWARWPLVLLVSGPLAFPGCSCEGGADGTGANASSGSSTESSGTNAGGSTGQFTTNSGGGGPCVNLECQQVACSGGAKTTVSGKVYEPAGTTPLYNVTVYVPNAPLADIPEGASCDQCGATLSGDPVVTALTDATGSFVLEDVPVGQNIPLVVQVGKWRRQIVLPNVEACVDTPTTDGDVRLPRSQAEGNLPRIALTTGGADPLECLLRKIGIDDAEFTNPDGNGRVNFFAGTGGTSQYQGGASFPAAQTLWASVDTLMPYDVVLLACEAGQNPGDKPTTSREAMEAYANAGGRIFMSHWHNVWLEQGVNQWPTTANWDFQSDPPEPYTGIVDQTFPKGAALAQWLLNVQGSTVLGELPITQPQHTLTTVNAAVNVQQWIYGAGPDTGSVKYFTFNAPLAAPDDQLCGRVVFSDIHVSSGDSTDSDFPSGCTTQNLSPQEKALLFMLFDLTACIIPDDDPPVPPPE